MIYILLNLLTISAFSADPVVSLHSYKEWKADKIQTVQSKLSQIKAQVDSIRAAKAQDLKESKGAKTASYDGLIKHYEQEMTQVQWNLEVAKDLSVTDYVALYLAVQPSKTRFQEAATHLSPAEVAELLEAYSDAVGGSASQPIGPTTAALKAGSTGLLSK